MQDIALQKHRELAGALERGEIADPVSMLIAVGISVGVSMLSRALAPKPPMQQVGLMKGTVQLQNSQQGVFIPEIYGGPPEVTIEAGSAVTWDDLVNSSSGGGGAWHKTSGTQYLWNAGAAIATAITTEDAFIDFTPDLPNYEKNIAIGFGTSTTTQNGTGVTLEIALIVANTNSGVDSSDNPITAHWFSVAVNGINGPQLGLWYAGDTFRVEKRDGAYHVYHNSAEVTNFSPPTPSGTVYIGIAGWSVGSGVSASAFKISNIGIAPSAASGGVKVPAMIVWAKSPLKHSYIQNQPVQGGKGHSTQQVEQVYYTIDLRSNFARGPLDLLRLYGNTDILMHQDARLDNPTGVYDGTNGTSGDYSPNTPPDPSREDNLGLLRGDGDLLDDGNGGHSGSIQRGASQIVFYEGTDIQDIDPTEEADIDTQYGEGSTSAHRNIAGTVNSMFNLQRWQNIPPNITAVLAHKELHYLSEIYDSLSQRIVDQNQDALLDSGDYDFSGLSAIWSRGMLMDGRPYSPQEIMDNAEIQDFYNYFTTEGDGKILAYENGTEPAITIPWQDFAFVDGGSDASQQTSIITVTKLDETKFSRSVSVQCINPGSDWDPDSQTTTRRVTLGNTVEQVQVQISGNPDEARAASSRRMYRTYVGEPVKFQLFWKYMHLYGGYKITTTDPEAGITYKIRLTSIIGGVGVKDCEGILLETESFSQSDVASLAPTYNPAQPLPSVTILSSMDLPAWRPEDVGKFGLSICGTPRNTSTQTWHGWALFIKRSGRYIKVGEFPAPAIMGRIVSVTGTLETDPNVTDNTSVITVDLYGTKALLENVTEADMIAGVNLAAFGDMMGGFATATRSADFLNRWELSTLRNGQNSTEDFVSTVSAGRNFALLNSAVKFVELDPGSDLNVNLFVKSVSLGESLDDASELTVVCTGMSARGPSINKDEFICLFDNITGDAHFEWIGIDPPAGSTLKVFDFEIRDSSDLSTIRTQIINPLLAKDAQSYAIWETPAIAGSGSVSGFEDGGLDILLAAGTVMVRSLNTVLVQDGVLAQWQVPDYGKVPFVMIHPDDQPPISSDSFFWSGHGASVYPELVSAISRQITPADKLGIYLRSDGIAEYHLNFSPHSSPIYISPTKVRFDIPYHMTVFAVDPTGPNPYGVRKPSWSRLVSEWRYIADAQKEDNSGSLPSTITARVRQNSFLSGGFPPGTWATKTFTRP